jgi:hypothetical protein
MRFVYLTALLTSLVSCFGNNSNTSTAETSDDLYTPSAMPDEVNRRVAQCFAKNWATEPLRTGSNPFYAYDSSAILQGVAWLTTEEDEGLDAIGYLLMLGSTAEQVMDNLETDLHGTAHEQRLADYQQVEMVLCVSSHLISYAMNGLTVLGADVAVDQYEGVCSQFAEIAAELMQRIGIDARMVGNIAERHAFDEVTLSDGTKYFVEPQLDPAVNNGIAVFLNPHH